jgi:O-antigen ligase
MMTLALPYPERQSTLSRLALAVFVCILVLHGTYIRNRASVAVPTADWLVLARLAACSVAFVVAIALIPKHVRWGFGAKAALFYVLAAGVSAIGSPYRATVTGYFVLLLGATTLMVALVYRARNVAQLLTIERIWLFTVGALVVKDAVTAIFFTDRSSSAEYGRLGMGVTNATEISLFAALLFWMSFRLARGGYDALLWLWRFFLLYILVAAKSRVSIAAFCAAGVCYVLLSTRDYLKRCLLVSCVGFVAVCPTFCLSLDQDWARTVTGYLKRGQDPQELRSMTGRTYIWGHILRQSQESPIIGHGYGVSRLTMGQVPGMSWQPHHCQNEVLEVLFGTGLLGLVPFAAMFLYSLKWIGRFSTLGEVFSEKLAVHGACLMTMLLVSAMFEVRLSGRLSPIQPLFFFYLTTLDREAHFRRLRIEPCTHDVGSQHGPAEVNRRQASARADNTHMTAKKHARGKVNT